MEDAIWTDSFLNTYKTKGDKLADEVISQLQENHCLEYVNSALAHLETNNQALPADLPEFMRDYLIQSARLPDWANPRAIKLAQNFFTARGSVFGVVLLCGSLPVLYAGGLGGAQILTATGQLNNHYARRAGETLRFILNAMEPNGLTPEGKGVRTIQKVRLMHAAIRYYAKRSPQAWPAQPDWGMPINQEELIGTLLAFSTKALEGLEKMGIAVSEEETEAYFHTWKVVGHMLGIEEEIIPATVEDAESLWNKIAQRNFFRTDSGMKLAKAHIAFLQHVIPGELFDDVALSLMRYLMGRKMTEKVLGLPRPGWTYAMIDFLRGLFGLREILLDCSHTLTQIAEKDSIQFMEGLAKHWMKNDSTPFRIPPSLTEK